MGLKWIKQTAGNYASKCGRFHIRKIRDSRKWGRTWTLTKLPQEPDELEVWQEFSTLAKCKDAADARVEFEDDGGPTAEDLGHAPGEEARDSKLKSVVYTRFSPRPETL